VTPNSLTLGSKLPYAGYHMTGTRNMPARPFLTVNQPVLDRMAAAMLRTLSQP
jgi:phage gpG-like protein